MKKYVALVRIVEADSDEAKAVKKNSFRRYVWNLGYLLRYLPEKDRHSKEGTVIKFCI